MQLPANPFKRALREQRHQTGLWVTLANPNSAELVAGSGFDWLLLDTEHTPALLPTVMAQLQAVAPYPTHAVVRPTWNDNLQIKRYLDIGAQTLLLPYVQNADEARQAVAGTRYAPRGVRGVGGTVRATRYGRVADYMRHCENELCLLIQAETGEALEQLDAMAAVDGVDGIFIGPFDLSIALGIPGRFDDPRHIAAVERVRLACERANKPCIMFCGSAEAAAGYFAQGFTSVTVSLDISILIDAAKAMSDTAFGK